MTARPSFLASLRPTRHEAVLFALLWLKLLVFFSGIFSVDRLDFHLGILGREIFRSALRPVYYSLVILLVLTVLNACSARRRLAGFVVLNLLLTALLALDLWYYRAFRALPSLGMLSAVGGIDLPLDHLTPLMRGLDLALLLDLGILAALRPVLPEPPPRSFRRLGAQVMAFTGLFLLVPPVAGGLLGSRSARAPLSLEKPLDLAQLITPLGFHALDAARFMEAGNGFLELSAGERLRIKGWLDANREAPVPARTTLAGRNLLIIQVESLESFVLGQTVAGVPVTPNLDALVRRGLHFTRFHEQVHLGMSSDADLMTNASVYPSRGRATFCAYPWARLPSLPRILAGRGYATLSLHPDPGSFWNVRQGHAGLGFGRIVDAGSFDCSDTFGMGLSDASFLAQAFPLIRDLPEPFYAFMVTLSSHEPFRLPDYLRELPLDPGLDDSPMGGYLQSVHYTDKHLGILLRRLEDGGLLDRTVVVVTGDHQGVHRYYEKELLQDPRAQPWWGGRDHRIPLIIAARGLQPAEIAVEGGQVDIMPTLLALLGVDPGDWGSCMMGRNLLGTARNHVVLADGTIRGAATPAQIERAREGLEIADLIIRGNYFNQAPVRMEARRSRDLSVPEHAAGLP